MSQFRLLAAQAAAGARRRAPRLPRPPLPDGGSRRALFISPWPPSHIGTIYRQARWVPHLAGHGVEVEIRCVLGDEGLAAIESGSPQERLRALRTALRSFPRILSAAAAADVVLLHRGVLPCSPWQRPTLERALVRANPAFVFDFFDALWIAPRRTRAAARTALARFLNPADPIETMLSAAAAATVSNEFLAAFARRYCGDVHVLPMVVEPSDFPRKEHSPRAPTVAGWMGNAGNLSRLASLAPALARAAGRRPLRLRVVSPTPVSFPGLPVDSLTHPWSPETEREDLLAADIGLLPLFDTELDRGKSPLKLLQFSAAGIPVVASPLALEGGGFRDGESIIVARTEADWEEALVRLAGEPARRARIGAAAREVVLRHYSYGANAEGFAGLLRRAARVRRRISSRESVGR